MVKGPWRNDAELGELRSLIGEAQAQEPRLAALRQYLGAPAAAVRPLPADKVLRSWIQKHEEEFVLQDGAGRPVRHHHELPPPVKNPESCCCW